MADDKNNTGDLNTGDLNTGFFNTITPSDILIFNKPANREVFEKLDKPSFIYFNLTEWVAESKMSDDEKKTNPTFFTTGGYLKKHDYKEAFKRSWDAASKEDRAKVFNLPNLTQIFLRKYQA